MSREDEIRAREEAATFGDWVTVDLSEYTDEGKPYTWVWEADMPYGNGMIAEMLTDGHREEEAIKRTYANAQFIAHARQDIPYLLDRNEFLMQKIRDIANVTERWGDVDPFTAEEHEYARHLNRLIEEVTDVILDNFTDEELQ